MPFVQCNFFSESLGVCVSTSVILPLSRSPLSEQRKHPTLYLLHGMSDDHTIWQRRTSIERYVEDYDLAVVMPAVNRSFYTDMASGSRYWTFVSEELPFISRALFNLSEAREDNFVAGLSMGGYGAFKLALAHPERFSFAASLSGALDIVSMTRSRDEAWLKEIRLVFGDLEKLRGSDHDLLALARKTAKSKTPGPRLYQYCGTEDFLYKDNLKFKAHAEKLGLDLAYDEGPGTHTWKYWDEKIQVFLNMLPLKPIHEQTSQIK